MKNKSLTLFCAKCGASFNPEYGREKTSKFCSRRCFLVSRWGEVRPPNKCPTCGGPASSTGRRDQRFCSFTCRVIAQTGEVRARKLIPYGAKGRYWARRLPDHPDADGKGYVMEHRLLMEAWIGRPLRQDEVVHHIDENPANNARDNLSLMTKRGHDTLHSRDRWRAYRIGRRLEKGV